MISVESWLKSFGFMRNPFETTEAGVEAHYSFDFLHETFVKPNGFDEILGHPSHPKSSLIFASRGKGKTSARLMTAHFCREGIFNKEIIGRKEKFSRVLPVHHTRFEGLLDLSGSQTALVDAHVNEILLRAVPALTDMIVRYSDVAERINDMDVLHRLELQYFFVAYQTHIPFKELRLARDLLGREISNLNESRSSIGFSLSGNSKQQVNLPAHEIVSHLLAFAQSGPIDQLGRFASLLVDLGIEAVYILVDGLDEIPETVDNFVVAAGLLIPLLANLNLMTNTPHLAFKVFVPAEMETLLLEATRKVRRDRLAIQIIELQEKELVEILKRRLAFCSDEVISSLDAISSVDMRGKMETEMAMRAVGNPRHLVLLGQYMLEHRCQVVESNDKQEAYLLTGDDLNWASRILGVEPIQESSVEGLSTEDVETQQELPSRSRAPSPSDDWFRHELPAPIALAYLVYQRESVAHIRIWKMYELVEASLAFLSQVLLALLYQTLNENTSLQLKKSGLRLERSSIGLWRIAMEKLPGMMAGFGIRSSFARACQRLLNKNGDFIQAINDERNRSAHDGPQSEKVCETLIEQYSYPLQQYLTGLSFLRESRLTKVLHVHKHDDKYLHRCTSYIGDAVVFPTIDIELGTPLDSEYLWFLGSDGPVNLHPLMLVTSNEKLGEDVWLYQGVDKDAIVYKSYGLGKTVYSDKYRKYVKHMLGN